MSLPYSRKGQRFSKSERSFIQSHRAAGIPVEKTARLLGRDVSELRTNPLITWTKLMKNYTPTADIIWAIRYAHEHYRPSLKKPLCSKQELADLIEEEERFGPQNRQALRGPTAPCPHRIKSLALYLCELRTDLDVGKK
jgi:hypothetical protein